MPKTQESKCANQVEACFLTFNESMKDLIGFNWQSLSSVNKSDSREKISDVDKLFFEVKLSFFVNKSRKHLITQSDENFKNVRLVLPHF